MKKTTIFLTMALSAFGCNQLGSYETEVDNSIFEVQQAFQVYEYAIGSGQAKLAEVVERAVWNGNPDENLDQISKEEESKLAEQTDSSSKNGPTLYQSNPGNFNDFVSISSEKVNDNSSLYFSEGSAGTYGMYWLYEGASNQMNLFGRAGSFDVNGIQMPKIFGPHLTISRDSGYISNAKFGNFIDNAGDDNAAMIAQDRNHWIWRPYPGWGVFWATKEGAKYQTGVDKSNPNEIVFVGGGETQAAIDLDKGTGYFKEIIVDSKWADFVFEDDYKLMELDQLENYIKSNKHLPGVPTAKTVRKEGVSIGQSQTQLLQKIEELTLYVLDLNRSNQKQSKRIAQLEKQLGQMQ